MKLLSIFIVGASALAAAQAQQSTFALDMAAPSFPTALPLASTTLLAQATAPAPGVNEVKGAANSRRATAGGRAAADGSSGEPVVISATVEKCIECKGSAKKRIAVLPTRVGSVAADAGASPDSLGQVVTDRLETVLRSRPELLVLGRSNLQGVLAEQELAAKGVTNATLAPQRGRVIPAELLLHVTLDRVDVSVDSRRQATSDAVRRLNQAHELERAAIRQRESAGEREVDAQQAYAQAAQFRAESQKMQAQLQQQAQAGSLSRGSMNLGLLHNAISSYGEASSTRDAETALNDAREARIDADRKLMQARQQKELAERAATTEVVEMRRTTATITVIWKAIDSMTNEVVAGDTIRRSDNIVDERRVVSTGSNSNEVGAVNRTQNLVNKLIDTAMDQVVTRVGESMEKVPFRGQLVRVDKGGVIINVGRNYGIEPGDTFSVRRIDMSLIDPATGRSLAGPGTLEGMVRVTEVSDQVAKAVVMQSAGKLSRGDVLEWVGVYK